jgi:thioredoxin-related protein
MFRFAESKRKENGTWSDMEHMSDVKLNELGAILGFSSTEKFQEKRIFIMLGSASCEGCQKIAKKYLEKLSQHAALSINPTSEEFFFNSIGTPFQPNTRVGVAKLVGGGHDLRSIFGIHVTPAIIEIDNKWSTKYVGFDGCMNWIDSEITHIQRN